MPFRIGPWEIGLILLVILIVFGVGKLPQVGEAIGKTMHSIRKAQTDDDVDEAPASKRTVRKAAARKA